MLPEQIAVMFSVIKPPEDLTIKSRIEMFFKKDLHLKMEKADTDKDWNTLNKLADRGFLDAMKYHRIGLGDVIELPYYDKWLIQYESAMNAFDMAQLRDEKYELYLKWSDLNDENKKLKEETKILETYREEMKEIEKIAPDVEDIVDVKDYIKKLKYMLSGLTDVMDENMEFHKEVDEMKEKVKKGFECYEKYKKKTEEIVAENNKLKAELVEAHSEWKKEGESRLKENEKLKAECNDKMTELAEYKKNMRAVLNMIEYTIGGGSDVSTKIHEILWNGADTTFESDGEEGVFDDE